MSWVRLRTFTKCPHHGSARSSDIHHMSDDPAESGCRHFHFDINGVLTIRRHFHFDINGVGAKWGHFFDIITRVLENRSGVLTIRRHFHFDINGVLTIRRHFHFDIDPARPVPHFPMTFPSDDRSGKNVPMTFRHDDSSHEKAGGGWKGLV